MNKRLIEMPLKSIALIGIAMSVAIVSCGKKEGQQQQQAAPDIAVVTVQTSDAELETSYPCIIKGKKDVDIRPQVSGFITKVCVDEGQHVSAGQTLFALSKNLLRRGNLLMQMGDKEGAGKDMQRYLQLNPEKIEELTGEFKAEGREHCR